MVDDGGFDVLFRPRLRERGGRQTVVQGRVAVLVRVLRVTAPQPGAEQCKGFEKQEDDKVGAHFGRS